MEGFCTFLFDVVVFFVIFVLIICLVLVGITVIKFVIILTNAQYFSFGENVSLCKS